LPHDSNLFEHICANRHFNFLALKGDPIHTDMASPEHKQQLYDFTLEQVLETRKSLPSVNNKEAAEKWAGTVSSYLVRMPLLPDRNTCLCH